MSSYSFNWKSHYVIRLLHECDWYVRGWALSMKSANSRNVIQVYLITATASHWEKKSNFIEIHEPAKCEKVIDVSAHRSHKHIGLWCPLSTSPSVICFVLSTLLQFVEQTYCTVHTSSVHENRNTPVPETWMYQTYPVKNVLPPPLPLKHNLYRKQRVSPPLTARMDYFHYALQETHSVEVKRL